MRDRLTKEFQELFIAEPLIVRSPGRVNMIGEHTDYNEGFVLPAAIDKAAYVAVSRRADNQVCLYAASYKEGYELSLDEIAPTTKGWPNYVLGVVDQLQQKGHLLGGFNLLLDGDVPLGAGLSSSAAVECATIFALNELFDLDLDRMALVKMAQMAEHKFAGVKCGIMDQFASMFGKKGHAVRLDCRSLEYTYVPLNLEGYRIVLLNTNVAHSLASSEYNTRRQQCEQGVAWISKHHPEVKSLRDATLNMVHQYILPQDALVYNRCKYVVEEYRRLLDACSFLEQGNLKALGKKMFETHEGLSQDYAVSCKELDFLVTAVKHNDAVIGARMMGGGFGGCTINLVQEAAVEELVTKLSKEYKASMGLDLSAYIAQVEDGTSLITKKTLQHV